MYLVEHYNKKAYNKAIISIKDYILMFHAKERLFYYVFRTIFHLK